MIKRNITSRLLDALSDMPFILLNGARQTGKSTLDDATVFAAAKEDAAGLCHAGKFSVA